MARLDSVESDSETGRAAARAKRKSGGASSASATKPISKSRKESMEIDEVSKEIQPDGEGGGGGGSDDDGKLSAQVPLDSEEAGSEEGDEEEYEIEAIIDARKGAFPQGKTGYLVKWKGYGEAENSWVNEDDAGNAGDLITEYWRKHKKEKQSGKKASIDNKPKSKRKSISGRDVSADASAQGKKRGRPKAKADKEDGSDREGESDAEEARASKKARKSNGAASKTKTKVTSKVNDADDDDDSPETPVGDMKKYMNISTWENLIATVDTVERGDGELLVYFTLKKDNERVKERSEVCAEKFPKRLIEFYESNLKWKIDDESASLGDA